MSIKLKAFEKSKKIKIGIEPVIEFDGGSLDGQAGCRRHSRRHKRHPGRHGRLGRQRRGG